MKTADVNESPLIKNSPLPLAKPFREISTSKTARWLDVSGMEVSAAQEKRAHRLFCLHNPDRYPIDDLRGVKLADDYFSRYADEFTPPQRREYGVHLLKQARALSEPVSPLTRTYGSSKLASQEDISLAWRMREEFVPSDLKGVFTKIASRPVGGLPADDYACLMYAFDKQANLQRLYGRHNVYDPWRTVLAEEAEKAPTFSENIGVDTIVEDDVLYLAHNDTGRAALRKLVTPERYVAYLNDPVGTFKGMQVLERQLIGRTARSLRCGGPLVR